MRTSRLLPPLLAAMPLLGMPLAQAAGQGQDAAAPPAAAVQAPEAAAPAPAPASSAPAPLSPPAAAPAAVPAGPAPATEAGSATNAAAANTAAELRPANAQVVQPELDRRDVRITHIPANDFEMGVFTGAYNTENFGASLVGGVRLGYHITEDVFLEAVYGQTKVSDTTFRDILPGGIFPTPTETLRYYDLSAGYNLLPGEIFLGRRYAKVSAFYVIAGLGVTQFNNASHQTVNAGAGMRVFLANWVALQADVRDHMFSLDLLGTKRTTTNLEATVGATFFF